MLHIVKGPETLRTYCGIHVLEDPDREGGVCPECDRLSRLAAAMTPVNEDPDYN